MVIFCTIRSWKIEVASCAPHQCAFSGNIFELKSTQYICFCLSFFRFAFFSPFPFHFLLKCAYSDRHDYRALNSAPSIPLLAHSVTITLQSQIAPFPSRLSWSVCLSPAAPSLHHCQTINAKPINTSPLRYTLSSRLPVRPFHWGRVSASACIQNTESSRGISEYARAHTHTGREAQLMCESCVLHDSQWGHIV